jgi:hypothetical protein
VTDYRNRRILAEAARVECWRTGPILRAATWTVAIELWRQAGRAAELGQPAGRKPLGLDAPENGLDRAGAPVGWLVRGDSPDGYLQPAGAPAPGYYVSTTALQDPKWRDTDPRRYFDAAALPGFVLPGHDLDPYRVQLGDYALVQFGPYRIWAQAFDRGPAGKMLELSVAACNALGIPDCARSGGVKGGVSITILPGSRKMSGPVTKPQLIEEINRAGIAAARAVGLRIGPG